ncbi:DUF2283 domain-containing protein [Laspinema sp. D1]|uniref:DUF2283 domain-containing protein n=2 Tax=Laspinema TaxID=2584823 RepID=A0ABT2MJB4_9CYAN|nr:DUF2283 domain-containing protein [Laspinema sp. D2a]
MDKGDRRFAEAIALTATLSEAFLLSDRFWQPWGIEWRKVTPNRWQHWPIAGNRGLNLQRSRSVVRVPKPQENITQTFRGRTMKISYNPETDVLNIYFQESPVEKREREQPDRILDYDKNGNLVRLKILNASQRVSNPQRVEYSVILPNPVTEEGKPLSLSDQLAFMQLPLAERRRILAAQSEAMIEHYEQDTEWREFQGSDIMVY